MDTEEEKETIRLMKEALAKRRGYADHFGWPIDRDIEECGVVQDLCRSLEKDSKSFISNVRRRGRGNDPPDCEGQGHDGQRIGIEVTELVDSDAIKAFKTSGQYRLADWDKEKLVMAIDHRLDAKNVPDRIKDGPYDSYIVVIHTDELLLDVDSVKSMLGAQKFAKRSLIDRAFLLFSYDPRFQIYPHMELEFVDT